MSQPQQLQGDVDGQLKNSSLSTISALLNSMMGGTMLAMPLLFKQTGMITSLVILLVSGFVSSKTCNIFIIHLAPKDNDVQDSIRRIMGGRWYEFFCLITGAYLIMLNVLYVVLINDQLYNILAFALDVSGHSASLAPKDEFSFSKMSEQWLAVISFLPLLAFLLIKNLNLVIKLAAFGTYSVVIYLVFIVYVFFDNVKAIDMSQIKLFSWDVGNLAGTSALAFTIHTVVAPICKTNQNQDNNSRDLFTCYGLGAGIYGFIGICGYFAIFNKPLCQHGAQTIIDCFPNDSWEPLIVAIAYLLTLVTVFPCFMDVSRKRLFSAFSSGPIEDRPRIIFNFGFMVVSFVFSILTPFVKLSDIMNINGAIFCFFFVYLIPVALHFRCLYGNSSEGEQTVYYKRGSFLEPSRESLITASVHTHVDQSELCPHLKSNPRQVSKVSRLVFYGCILVLGLATMVYGLYSSIMIFV